MPVALSQIRDLLLPGLWGISGKYGMIERQWPKIFRQTNSEMALERRAAMRYLGLAQLKQEGAPTSFDNAAGQRFVYNAEHLEIGLGYAITRKAIDDNLYKAEFGPSNDGLMESFKETEEIYAANVLNTATTFNQAVQGDGVSLINSTGHPIDPPFASIPNQPSPDVDLNETSLLNALITIRSTWRDNAGLKIHARGRKVIAPPNLEPICLRLFRSELRPGTAENDVNAILGMNDSLKEGYMIFDYLTSSFAWFILTNHDGLIFFNRKPFEMDMSVEFTTDNLLVKGYQRYVPTYYDWRAIWGTFPLT
jgi:hypothetical protein